MNLSEIRRTATAWRFGRPGAQPELLDRIGCGDQPVAVMLGCWESGIELDQLSCAQPGAILVMQNAGAVAPVPGDTCAAGDMRSLAFALAQPGVQHLIVCGHTNCKFLTGLSCQSEVESRNQQSASSGNQNRANYAIPNIAKRLSCDFARWHVLEQLDKLASHSDIKQRIAQQTLNLHGWIRDDSRSQIEYYDAWRDRFVTHSECAKSG